MASSSPDAGATTKPAKAPAKPQPMRPTAALTASDLPRKFGHYVLLRRIAKGGMGEVMLAAALGLEGAERPVIIKTIRSEHRTDKSFNARFLDEARVQSQLEHPGVAQVVEATTDEESGEPYVVVEHVDGKSLGDVRARALTSGQRVEWHEAVAVAQLAAEALAHVHERTDAQGRPLAIVHRDLSPQNVMVSFGGEIKIIDFGTARGENRRCHTVSGVVFAKPGYVAPEVANGDTGDFRVDQYALGVMLWELCAGRRFLSGEASDHMTSVAKNERNLPPIAEIAGAPRQIDEILRRLTAFDRDERYARTKDAARDLATLLSGAPALAGGERGVRGRVAGLMSRLFEGESARARREFTRLVLEARKLLGNARTPQAATSDVVQVMKDEQEGFLPGTRYQVLRELGRGQGTTVLEAEHVDLGRRVAVKIVDVTGAGAVACETRLRREARVLASVTLPGVVRLIDAGKTLDRRAYFITELGAGEPLTRRLERGPELGWIEALEICDRLLAVLERVHARGVIHRDIKPDNVLLDDTGAVTLLDFGIALTKDKLDFSDLDTPGPGRPQVALYGTPEYMAPEQAARPVDADERADIYAVGAVLYEMLTGRLPFVADSAVGLIEAKAQGSAEPPSERAPARGIAREADELCLRALARHPSLRFEHAGAMRTAIKKALAAPARRQRRRRAFGFALVTSVMAGASVVLAMGLPRLGPAAPAPVQAAAAAGGVTPEPLLAPPGPSPEPTVDARPELAAAPPPISPEPEIAAAEPAPDAPAAILDESEASPERAAPKPRPKKDKKARRAETKKGDAETKKKPRKRKGKKKEPEAE